MELKLTLRQAASICHINLKTAFLWRHRFLMAKTAKTQDTLSGIIEVDEFFMAYSEKGSKKLTNGQKRGSAVVMLIKERKMNKSPYYYQLIVVNIW